ncbi:hypothetical protein [Streptantibioticus ferralitis]|uniref:Uncharacterized protein n=1 Tax=Streptantibioticus ferralitis TaxID=236510 RepID=A0ABT5Z0P7_9ACTN|nr:hypothetical protein [Streptantibioticus ferralitis]MDF2257407.1 hypothetical protein [Streptantibioticus ferralitis]
MSTVPNGDPYVATSTTRTRWAARDPGALVRSLSEGPAVDPLHVPLGGFPAKAVTRGDHLLSLPGNRMRTAVDWTLGTVMSRQTTRLSLVRDRAAPLATRPREHTPTESRAAERDRTTSLDSWGVRLV